MRWIRLLQSLLFSRYRSRLSVHETSTITFRVWLTDIDASIMNHAAMMTVFEMGRIDFMVRTGFFKIARKRNWYFPSSSISVQFFRPLKAFQQAVLTTRLFHVDDQFVFTEQKIIRQGKDIAICIVKSKVKSGKQSVPSDEILHLLNASHKPVGSPGLIELYQRNDDSLKGAFCK